uniref:Uncharacterized protein n=1 Tax=Arundo donax TaxID=35708 RepID=A0A0A8YRK6_ARUDO
MRDAKFVACMFLHSSSKGLQGHVKPFSRL